MQPAAGLIGAGAAHAARTLADAAGGLCGFLSAELVHHFQEGHGLNGRFGGAGSLLDRKKRVLRRALAASLDLTAVLLPSAALPLPAGKLAQRLRAARAFAAEMALGRLADREALAVRIDLRTIASADARGADSAALRAMKKLVLRSHAGARQRGSLSARQRLQHHLRV